FHPKMLRARVHDITGRTPGKNWHYGFLRRHSSLFMSKPRGLDPKRGQNFNKSTVGEFFEMRKQLNEKYDDIPPEHNWNMDEKGNQMGGGRKNDGSKYIHSVDDPDRYRMHSDNLELVTIIECVSAAGAKMPPWFVLSNGPVPDIRDLKGQVSGLATSPSGWTDREIAEKWFAEVFVPEAEKHRVNDKPIVLTIDGHDSHETDAIKKAAYKHGIIVHAFPSKTTHKLQPLDVGVFSSVQRAWTKHCDARLVEGVEIDRYNFIHEYMSIHHVITPELIRSAFKKTGIHPLDPSVFTDRDFAPSTVTSSTAHLPPSYPAEGDEDEESGRDSDGEESDEDGEGQLEECADHEGTDTDTDTENSPNNPCYSMPQSAAPHEPSLTAISTSDPSPSPAGESLASSTTASVAPNCRLTRSLSPLNEPLPTPVMPSYAHAMTLSKEELWNELQRMYTQNKTLVTTITMLTGEIQAANSHCTLARRELAASRLELANQKKKKRRKSTKLRARFVTLPELEEDFNKEEAERREKERTEAEKQAKKKTDGDARLAQINRDIATRTFDAALTSYRRKDDLVALAGALQLSMEGHVSDLTERIKEHLKPHFEDPAKSDIANNPRFAALFGKGKSRATNPSAGPATRRRNNAPVNITDPQVVVSGVDATGPHDPSHPGSFAAPHFLATHPNHIALNPPHNHFNRAEQSSHGTLVRPHLQYFEPPPIASSSNSNYPAYAINHTAYQNHPGMYINPVYNPLLHSAYNHPSYSYSTT
ncbi:DDE-domain-containing protein, partial [Leucogyrophana mollusca]